MENKNTRKQYRLPNYDYSQNGAYFITICIKNKQPILSKIVVGTSSARPKLVQLTKIGAIVDKGIRGINQHYENVFVDNYVIMPNHIHLLIRIQNDNAQITPVPTISRIIQQFKGYVTKQVGKPIWQEKSYDHVIRDDYDYMVRYQYIDDNPAKWINNKNLP